MAKHNMKPPCGENCHFKCTLSFSSDDRRKIHDEYWSKSAQQRRQFMLDYVTQKAVARKTKGCVPSRRSFSYVYQLKLSSEQRGGPKQVCQKFFTATLGLRSNNSVIHQAMASLSDIGEIGIASDRRGSRTPKHKIPEDLKQLIKDHIKSFNPQVHHYRRVHAPNRRYLPSDLSAMLMHEHFVATHPDHQVGYQTYRREVADMNISFVQLGNEKCDFCMAAKLHTNEKHKGEAKPESCEDCAEHALHVLKFPKARKHYEHDQKRVLKPGEVVVSADLEKVIMLPIIRGSKTCVFAPRLVAFNESFANLNSNVADKKTYAVLWHDAIAGRDASDIACAFWTFLLKCRDAEKVTIWMDNCTGQNKNYTLMSCLFHAVNRYDSATQEINLKYLIPGHTFMSADAFHGKVEASLKGRNIYDFEDFVDAVAAAKFGRVVPLQLSLIHENLRCWANEFQPARLKNSNPRFYLKVYLHPQLENSCSIVKC